MQCSDAVWFGVPPMNSAKLFAFASAAAATGCGERLSPFQGLMILPVRSRGVAPGYCISPRCGFVGRMVQNRERARQNTAKKRRVAALTSYAVAFANASPEGAQYNSQGRRPWETTHHIFQALKGRNPPPSIFRPFRAGWFFARSIQGRRPWLLYFAALRLRWPYSPNRERARQNTAKKRRVAALASYLIAIANPSPEGAKENSQGRSPWTANQNILKP
jgi:hypothetical protein